MEALAPWVPVQPQRGHEEDGGGMSAVRVREGEESPAQPAGESCL
jgi:hypothetical protein